MNLQNINFYFHLCSKLIIAADTEKQLFPWKSLESLLNSNYLGRPFYRKIFFDFFEYALKVFWNITNSYKPRRIKVYKNFCIILHNTNDNAKWENIMKMYELRGPLTSSSTIWIVTSFFPLTIVKHFISLHTDKISKREVSSYVFLLKWNKKNYCACFSNDGTTWNTSSFLAIVISSK